jgi:hypothetical protein
MKIILSNVLPVIITTSVSPFQMKPTRCTLLLSIFIATSVHVSGNYVPIIRRTYCIYQCRIDTVISPGDGHIVARNMYRRSNKYTKK